MLLISVFSLITITAGFFIKDGNSDVYRLIQFTDYIISGIFFIDFCLSFKRAEKKLSYMKWGWIDLLASIPTIDLFRYGKLARVFRIITLLKAFKSVRHLVGALKMNKRKSIVYILAISSLSLCIFSSVLILSFEGQLSQSNIKNIYDAIWWTFVTITSVGYGDHYPVSGEGRVLASILMLFGVGVFSSLSGLFVSYLLDKDGNGQVDLEVDDLKVQIKELKEIILSLKEQEGSENKTKLHIEDDAA
jgi:voltage-gated potassium channel